MQRFFIVLFIFILFLFSACEEPGDISATLSTPVIHFIDVGDGDSILIKSGDFDILIDGGLKKEGPKLIKYLKKQNINEIDIMIATHPHKDHIGGLLYVLKEYQVNTIIDSGYGIDTALYKQYIKNAKNEPDSIFLYDDNMRFDIDENTYFEIIETGDSWGDEVNNYSVVSRLVYKDFSFLFAGDIEFEAEKVLHQMFLEDENFTGYDVLKVAHHGSVKSSSHGFISTIKPDYSIIMTGKTNEYGYPHKETVDLLKDLGSKVYRTDIDGNIVFKIDGDKLTVETAK
jgi:competence protein ComEC